MTLLKILKNKALTITFSELQATKIYESLDKEWLITPKTDEAQLSQIRTSSNQTTENSSDDITIYTDKINQVIDQGYETYAMLLEYNGTKQKNTFYNLVLHKRGDNYYIYTLRFISSENNNANLRGGGETDISGKPGIVPYDGWVDGGDDGNSGGDDPDYECWEITVTIEHACTGSIPHFVGDNCYCGTGPDFPCTPPYNEVDTTSYCEYTGGDGAGPTPGGGDPDSNPDDVDAVKPEQKCPDGQVKDKDGNCVDKPCEKDPVPNPEIAPQTNSGLSGGLHNTCTRSGSGCSGNNSRKAHDGIDIKNPLGAPIFAMYDGTARLATQYDDENNVVGAGYHISITSTINGESVRLVYFHLKEDNRASGVVKAGDIIGYQGDSGNLKSAIKQGYTESHVHIKARENGVKVDPLDYIATTINPNTGQITSPCQ